jgi:hypothetical protein
LRVPHPNSPAGRKFDWSPLGLPHPDSPAGRTFDWSSLGVPHPDSPAGRTLDWQSELIGIKRSVGQDLVYQMNEMERLLAKLSDSLREALPDTSLRVIYDRRMGFIRQTYGTGQPAGSGGDPTALVQHLESQMDWVEAYPGHPVERTNNQELKLALANLPMAWQQGAKQREELLHQITILAERFYEAANRSVQKQWADAQRSGKREELIAKWKAELLKPLTHGSAGVSGEAVESAVQQRRPARTADSPKDKPLLPPAKTWIEFRLIDEDGNPVSNAAYKVKLADGSIKDGTLNAEGSVRFNDIDPGRCQIMFPEIDGREWRA